MTARFNPIRPLAIGSLAAAAALLTLGPGTGCNIVGPAIYFIGGPPKIPPAYTLEKDKPTLIFVDDPGSRVPELMTRRRIGQATEKTLLDEKVLTNVISQDAAAQVVARERYGSPLGIVEVGQAAGAKVVVYALVEEFTLSAEPGTYSPMAKLRVKALDVDGKKRLWPTEDPGWFPLTVSLPVRSGSPPTNMSEAAIAERALADYVGVALAKLFFEHTNEQTGERLMERTTETRS